MQFLNPAILWALTAVSIPIIIHLFNFRRYTTYYFSHVSFLTQVKKDTRSKSNLKNILLLFIRIFCILFLVLAFARPYINKGPVVTHQGTPFVAIYIDNSFSMEAEGSQGILLEEAKMKTLQIMDAFPYQTKYLLVTNSFMGTYNNWVGRELMMERVSQVTSGHQQKNANQIYNQIYKLLPDTDSTINLNIFLISDFQEPVVNKPLVQKNLAGNHFAIVLHNPKTNNLSIDSIWNETPGHYRGKKELLNVKLKNYATETFRNLPVQLFVNDSLKTSLVVTIEKESEQIIQIPYIENDTGLMFLKVALNDYPITFDNSFFFNYSVNPKNSILLVQGEDASPYFSVLFKNDDHFILHQVSEKEIPYNEFNRYQTIFLNSVKNYSTGTLNELNQYIEKGGTLVYIPVKNEKTSIPDPLLARISTIQMGEWLPQQGALVKLDEKHTLFSDVFKRNPIESKMPTYSGFYNLHLSVPEKNEVLFYSESDAELFVKEFVKEGVLYISALPLQYEITDLGTHPFFVPLFYNIALQSSSNQPLYFPILSNPMAKITYQGYRGETILLQGTKSEPELMPTFRYQNGIFYIYPESEHIKAGSYRVELEKNIIGGVSFNYNRQESVTHYLNETQLLDWYKKSGIENISILETNKPTVTHHLKKNELGTDLTQWMLIGLGLFLFLELLILKWN